jgi:hypothetical protein
MRAGFEGWRGLQRAADGRNVVATSRASSPAPPPPPQPPTPPHAPTQHPCPPDTTRLQVLEALEPGVDVVHQHLAEDDDLLVAPLHEAWGDGEG